MALPLYQEDFWWFNDKIFLSDNIEKYQGFVYVIVDLTNNKKYVGRKYFYSIRKVKNKRNRQRVESDWKDYWSSSKSLQKLVEEKGKANFKRIILSLHITRGDTNYSEIKEQFIRNVLESNDYYNDTISKYNKVTPRIIESRCYNTITDQSSSTNDSAPQGAIV